ncbi:LysR substrate-binding domain-containing protein [Methylonatrum kenyense]|uniref:LysR substrate-binding domain-containing protein n=1 Tax=Methylonatrum kenyense TaxID=455253 RepID=UPI0020BD5650|nr:LysR substrate-binding domain-containing protein [Methylonatrum kenyense]MCK8515231.1 LysR substrate-binding domain-containing protein [Methylonatrum kenyense]
MNLRDLRYLVAVAEHRHFGRAAESCQVSQPTLSSQIKKLEGFLGVQLVERSSKQVMLTAVGEAVASRARQILAAVDDLVEVARSASDPLAGDFRLGLIPTVAPYLLPALIPVLRETFPRLRPVLQEEQTSVLLERLRHGEIDAAILAVPVDGIDAFQRLHLYDEPFLLAVPRGHRLDRVDSVSLECLRDEQVLLLEDGHCLRDQALDICRMVGAREEREFRAASLETLRQMVAAGGGVTLLPALAGGDPDTAGGLGNLVLHRFSPSPPMRHIAMVLRKGSAREPTVRDIAETICRMPLVERLVGDPDSLG